MGLVLVALGLSCSAARGIVQTKDQTCVLCIGRQILIHCTTREVPLQVSLTVKQFKVVLASQSVVKMKQGNTLKALRNSTWCIADAQ